MLVLKLPHSLSAVSSDSSTLPTILSGSINGFDEATNN